MVVLAGILAAAVILLFRPPGGAAGRFRRAVGSTGPGRAAGIRAMPGDGSVGRSARHSASALSWRKIHRAGQGRGQLSLTLVVQQLAALLKGGRTPARLWDELWLVHHGRPEAGPLPVEDIAGRLGPARGSGAGRNGPGLSPGSLTMLGAVRAAAFRGLPVSEAIRKSAAGGISAQLPAGSSGSGWSWPRALTLPKPAAVRWLMSSRGLRPSWRWKTTPTPQGRQHWPGQRPQ